MANEDKIKPPKIKAKRPFVVEPTERKVYDLWAPNGLQVTGSGLGTDTARGSIPVIRYRETADGPELGPPDSADRIDLGDVYDQAEKYPNLKQALVFLHLFVEEIMAARNQL